jgi:hypothetical protein
MTELDKDALEKAFGTFWGRTAEKHHNYREPLEAAIRAYLSAAPVMGAEQIMLLRKLDTWDRTWPKSRIYNETCHRQCEGELDAVIAHARGIIAQHDAALAAARGG